MMLIIGVKNMARKKGTVTAAAQSQYGYFVQLQETGDYYFNTKFEPPCGDGDVVGIEYTDKGKGRGNVTKIKLLESNGPGFQKKAPPAKRGAAGGYNDPARQDSIIFQSSRKDALVFVDLLIRNEAFALKGKAGEKALQISELVTQLTAKFFADAADPRNSDCLKGAEDLAKEDDEWHDGAQEEAANEEWDGEDEWDD